MAQQIPTPTRAFSAVRLIGTFLETEVFPHLNRHRPTDERLYLLWSYFQRLFPVVRGLTFLPQPSFFQLTLAGARNLLENLVDVVHLTHGRSSDVVERIEAWEASAKLKAAESALRYLGLHPDLDLQKVFQAFVDREGAQIRTDRQRFWSNGRHPDRWTGRNLLVDCIDSDKFEPSFLLEQFYETQYRQWNWSIHGSAFAGVRGLSMEAIDTIYVQSQAKAAEFALQSTTLILSQLGFLRHLQPRMEQIVGEFAGLLVPPQDLSA